MSPLFKKIYRPNILLIIIFIQTLGLVKLLTSTISDYYTSSSRVLAEVQVDPDEVYKACLKKPVVDRENCAREIGINLVGQTITTQAKINGCMKLRPVFYRFCLEELRQFP